MSKRTNRVLCIAACVSFAGIFSARPAPPIDCNCVSNLPALTVTCPGVVPNVCTIAANCLSTNVLPGSCTQNFPPGMQFPAGTYPLTLQVLDLQSNVYNCTVTFTVLPQSPPPPLTVACPTNKTVECGSAWSFDSPTILSSCCGVTITSSDAVLSGNGCSQVLQRTWQITDGCGNTASCNQKVTTVDTTLPGRACGINLVPNPSFENYTNCPSMISQLDLASPWFTPSDGTSDLFSPCAGPSSYVCTPTNFAGVQVPFSGQAYAGAAVWSVYGLNTNNSYRDYREYLEVPLIAPLIGGQRYQVSFHVSRADNNRYAVAELGAYFSKLPLLTNGYAQNFPVVPQVENSGLLLSTNTWMVVQGTFIANGAENFLTLGNFRTDLNTTWTNANPNAPTPDYAYYYFDDVSVTMLCDPLTNKTVQCGQPWEFDFNQFMALDACSGMNVTVNTTTTTNGYCPQVIQRDWALADVCGNTNLLTQTITVVDTNPPVLMCVAGANLVPNPQFENYSYCPYFFSQVSDAAPWFNPTVATPDYLNACATFAPVSVPNNIMGSQTAFSGNGYMGAYAYSVYGTNPVPGYREYIEAPLLAPLQAGLSYQVSFHVCLADTSGWAIANLGAHLSVGPVLNGAIQGPLNVVPQIANSPSNLLTNKTSWMLIQGTYIAAGGEDHITLGNFLSDALTTAVTNAAGTNQTYYYYDDVAVVPLCSFTNKTVPCGSAWDFDTPLAYDECSADYLSIFVTSTTVTGLCPKVYTRVWTIYDACGNSITATQTVTEIDTTPPNLLCSGINLVPNPSFENVSACPGAPSYLENAKPWYSGTPGSSDLYHGCTPFASTVSTPANWMGTQAAFDGVGYGGSYVYFPGGNTTNSYREYLEAPLLAPLVPGQAYAVSFRVSRADNCAYAIAEIGAHLTVGPDTNYPSSHLAVTPQIVNPSANIITSATNWTLISGVYVASGGEDHITLGNFRTDANTTASFMGGTYNSGYYYYDDIKVIALCTNVPVKNVACGAPWNFDPAPLAFDACSGSNVTVTVTSTVTNTVCPINAVRTWTLTDACGNSTNWSQTVLGSTNGGVLTVNCGCLQDSAISLLTTNACQAAVPNLSVLSNSPCIANNCGNINIAQSPAAGTIVGAGQNNITVKISNCSGITNTCILPFFVNPPSSIITCPANIYVIGCSNNSAIVHYAATATGNTGPIVYSPPSGSVFPLGTTAVTCTATSSCGGMAVCSFNVVVTPVPRKFGCITKVIGIITYPPPTARVIHLPDFPDGGIGVDFADLSGTEGVRFDLGAAEKFTFSTMLDFYAPEGASFELRLPPAPGTTMATTLVNFHRTGPPPGRWDARVNPQLVNDPNAQFRSIATGTNGELFSSFTEDATELATNDLLRISLMGWATGTVLNVTLDCQTHELVLGTSADYSVRKGPRNWDGCIYGLGPVTKTNKTARVFLTPQTSNPQPPITTLDLVVSNLTTIGFYNPSITMSGRKWGDGHVTLMKAYDDGAERGMEFYSLGPDGGVETDLGFAANFTLRTTSIDTNGLPPASQQFAIRGWPPGTTTNRPPPPVINVRLAPDSSGLGGVQLGADFANWGVSMVTLQLWNGTTLVSQTNHVPALPDGSFATLAGFPGILGCPGVGIVSLSDTNPIFVLSGMSCGSLGCVGTELRIIAEPSKGYTPPTAYTGLSIITGGESDYLAYRLQTSPACSPVPLQVTPTADGVMLTWPADGFHLQGAESVAGPWYDLEVGCPAVIPASEGSRVFRLRCD